MTDDPKDYSVGYGKPPKHSQFRKGQSGNPNGRTKGSRNLKTDLAEELAKLIDVNEGGRRKRDSKQQAYIMRLVEKALGGDMQALKALIDLHTRAFGLGDPETSGTELNADDQEILAAYRHQSTSTETAGLTRPADPDSTLPDDDVSGAEDGEESGHDDSETE